MPEILKGSLGPEQQFKKYLSETFNTGINNIIGIIGSPYFNIFFIRLNDGKAGVVLIKIKNTEIKEIKKTNTLA